MIKSFRQGCDVKTEVCLGCDRFILHPGVGDPDPENHVAWGTRKTLGPSGARQEKGLCELTRQSGPQHTPGASAQVDPADIELFAILGLQTGML